MKKVVLPPAVRNAPPAYSTPVGEIARASTGPLVIPTAVAPVPVIQAPVHWAFAPGARPQDVSTRAADLRTMVALDGRMDESPARRPPPLQAHLWAKERTHAAALRG